MSGGVLYKTCHIMNTMIWPADNGIHEFTSAAIHVVLLSVAVIHKWLLLPQGSARNI